MDHAIITDNPPQRGLDDSDANVFRPDPKRGSPGHPHNHFVLLHSDELDRARIALEEWTEHIVDDALDGFTHPGSMGNCQQKRNCWGVL